MNRKTRKTKKVATGGYIEKPKAVISETVAYVPPVNTKKLIYAKMPINRYTKFKYKEYVFEFNSSLDPVPVEVPSHIADTLLKMVDEGCRCHSGTHHKLFREVN